MRYLFGFLCVCAMVWTSPENASAQDAEEAATPEPSLQEPSSEPASEGPALQLKLDSAGVDVVPSPPRTVDGYTLEEMERRVRRAGIGLSVSGGVLFAGVVMGAIALSEAAPFFCILEACPPTADWAAPVGWTGALLTVGNGRVTDALGFTRRVVHEGRLRFPEMPCIRCGATTPTVDPNRWTIYKTQGTYPDNPSVFRCEMGNHSFTLAALIAHHCSTEPKVQALLTKIGICEPQLIRTYTAEYDGNSVTSKDAEAAAREVLPSVHDCTVRLVGLDCASLEIGKQLAAQCRDDLPWATVDVNPDGTLIDQGWHKARLTDQERIRQSARDSHAKFAKIVALDEATEDFHRAEKVRLGL